MDRRKLLKGAVGLTSLGVIGSCCKLDAGLGHLQKEESKSKLSLSRLDYNKEDVVIANNREYILPLAQPDNQEILEEFITPTRNLNRSGFVDFVCSSMLFWAFDDNSFSMSFRSNTDRVNYTVEKLEMDNSGKYEVIASVNVFKKVNDHPYIKTKAYTRLLEEMLEKDTLNFKYPNAPTDKVCVFQFLIQEVENA